MRYFSIDELTRSAVALQKGIDNTPSPEVAKNLEALVNNVLDPLREKFGRPILVNSGYRCPELNKAVGGARNSDHLFGLACDIHSGTKEGNKELFRLIMENFRFKQLIDERNFSWVHVSYDPKNLKCQVLKL